MGEASHDAENRERAVIADPVRVLFVGFDPSGLTLLLLRL